MCPVVVWEPISGLVESELRKGSSAFSVVSYTEYGAPTPSFGRGR